MDRKKNKKEWTKFKVGKPSKRQNWTEPTCQSLHVISHVSHINSALNIFECGKIKAGLVFDESKLNKERILVVWLSPNDWHGAGGFRYGNIRFNFEWENILDSMNYYWIESIAYGIPACRILLSPNDYTSKFPGYDPTIGDGPWWHDEGNDLHYWNGAKCLEIMIEKDINITDTTTIDFVDHHPNYCNIEPGNCPDRRLYRAYAGARFIAALIGRENKSNISKYFSKYPNKIEDTILKSSLSILWRDLCITDEFTGDIRSNKDIALPLARAILNSYAAMNHEEQDLLSSLFCSKKALVNSCAKIVASTLNIPNWKNLTVDLSSRKRRKAKS